jgi:hypothetical protein
MAFELQLNPANRGMSFPKLENAKSRRIAAEVINHLGGKVMKVFKV